MMFRRRSLATRQAATIRHLEADLADARTQLAAAQDLAGKRYDLLKAVYRENEALRVRFIASQRDALGNPAPATVRMPRIRSLTPGPVIDLTQPGDETQLLTAWTETVR